MAKMTTMELRYRHERDLDATTHWIDLEGVPNWVTGPRSLYWRVPGRPDLAPPPVLDAFVIGLLLQASVVGGDLRVHGPMSRGGLFHAERLLELRTHTSQLRYRPLRILPESIIDDVSSPADERSAVLAFSGGLDSTHAAVWHGTQSDREDALNLRALVMAYGFDAPLGRPDIFSRMMERARPVSERLSVPLQHVETNSKAFCGQVWPQSSTPLAAVLLSLFWEEVKYGIFGGGLEYSSNFLAQGHQPLFDQHCSGDLFALITDATGLSRKRKLEFLAQHRWSITGLKVCWEGPDVSRNCGKCLKCLFTMLNFRMAGLDERLAFDTSFDPESLRKVAPGTMYDARDLGEVCWRDMRDDPNLVAETEVVREILSRVPPRSKSAIVADSLLHKVAPPWVEDSILAAQLRARPLARAAKRSIRRYRGKLRRKPSTAPLVVPR